MYRGITNFLRGYVTVRIESPTPEQVINLCAVHEIPFWNLCWIDEISFRMCTTRAGVRKLRHISNAAVTVGRERGAPVLLGRLRRHYALLAGALALLLFLFGGNFFIWGFEVTGNDMVATETILRALEDYGITVGSPGMKIDQERLRNHVLLELPDISWLVVNVKGCTAHVQVVERLRPPQILSDADSSNVVASRDGLVTKIRVLDGKGQVSEGSTVLKGQLLISGVADSAQSGMRLMHSQGEVWARTWYDLSVLVPLTVQGQTAQEEETTHISLDFGKRRINLYTKGSMMAAGCDKIIQYKPLMLPGGLLLPITVVRERTVGHTTAPLHRTAEQAYEEGKTELLALLQQQMTEDGSVGETRFATAQQGNCLLVTLRAECLEQIGQQMLLPKE